MWEATPYTSRAFAFAFDLRPVSHPQIKSSPHSWEEL
jgi:hypothetical protein